MGDKKNNLLLNEQTLSEDELNEVTGGFSFSSIFSVLSSLFKRTSSQNERDAVRAGLTRPNPNGSK